MEQLELNLSDHAYLGSSLGRDAGGRVVFVPFSIPGERVKVDIVEAHKRWALGQINSLLHPSPLRVEPRCQHFQECGGCHYQHMSYDLQCAAKAEILRSQIERLGRLEHPPVRELIPSPSPWNTRNHIQFSLDSQGRVGYRGARSERVVPINECHLPDPVINEIWPSLEISPFPGLERVALRLGDPGEIMIVFQGSGAPDFEMEIDFPASVVWLNDGNPSVLAGRGSFEITILDRTFQVSAGSFFQVHTALAAQLITLVLSALEDKPASRVLDLYAGVGFFSAFLAAAGHSLIAVEQSPSAADDFEVNLSEFDDIALFQAPVDQVLPTLQFQPDVVVVDPPRAGLGPRVTAEILDLSPAKLVYVSCDPTTLARDSRWLIEGGYNPKGITPIDMFPQTFHIESVSIWEKQR
jgi:23S rRNA (uracil1939-C5)-methyltransferase